MNENKPIILEISNHIATIILNNPQQHNAFDDHLIEQFNEILIKINNNQAIRVVILRAEGKNFSSGANLNWMKSMANYSLAENKKDALKLATLLKKLDTLNKPTITLIQGQSFGGALGLIACSDIAIASEDASFCFSEVKLGLTPATIAPYIVRKVNYSFARYYFISAKRFDAKTAYQMGLIHQMVHPDQLLETGLKLSESIKKNGPEAMRATKNLLQHLNPIDDEIINLTAEQLAEIRISKEGQEGIRAFLTKTQPNWIKITHDD